MIELLACTAVAAGFFLAGRYIAFLHLEKTQVMKDMVEFISFFETKLRFAAPPVSDIIRSSCGRSGRLNGFAEACAAAVSQGEPFPTAWNEALDSEKELCRLIGKAKDEVIAFGAELGTTDLQGQLSCCDYYKHIFCSEYEKRNFESERSAKLFPTLGAMLGVLTIIFSV